MSFWRGSVCLLASRTCVLHHLGVSLCGFGSVGVCVVTCDLQEAGRQREPPALSLSKFLGTCVPVGDFHSPGELSGFEAMAVTSRRQEPRLLYSPAPFPAPAWYRWHVTNI